MAAPWRGKGNLCGSIDSGVTGDHAAGNSHVFTRVDGAHAQTSARVEVPFQLDVSECVRIAIYLNARGKSGVIRLGRAMSTTTAQRSLCRTVRVTASIGDEFVNTVFRPHLAASLDPVTGNVTTRYQTASATVFALNCSPRTAVSAASAFGPPPRTPAVTSAMIEESSLPRAFLRVQPFAPKFQRRRRECARCNSYARTYEIDST